MNEANNYYLLLRLSQFEEGAIGWPVGPHVDFSSFSFRVTFGLGLASGTEGL